jgi:hypothetical protein
LLGSDPRPTTEVLLEAVFSMWSIRGYMTQPTELVGEQSARGLLQFNTYDLLLLEADS